MFVVVGRLASDGHFSLVCLCRFRDSYNVFGCCDLIFISLVYSVYLGYSCWTVFCGFEFRATLF